MTSGSNHGRIGFGLVGRVTPCAPGMAGNERRARSDAPYLGT